MRARNFLIQITYRKKVYHNTYNRQSQRKMFRFLLYFLNALKEYIIL